MATAKLTVEEIRQSDPWRTDDLRLDLSAYPHLTPLADAPVDDDKFAPLPHEQKRDTGELKKFLTAPDREAIEWLKDPELLKQYDEQHGKGTTVYASNVPFRIYQREGKWRAKGTTPDGTVHKFTAATRDGLFPKITSAVNENTIRALTDSERLQVVRLAQSGNTNGAIARYLEFAIGVERASRYRSPEEMLGDPALAEVFDECSLLTWFAGRPNVQDSEEWSQFLDLYAGGRPYTHQLLDGAYTAFEKSQYTAALFGNTRVREEQATPPTPRQIEDLDDAQVERLFTDTKREFV